MPRVGLNTTAVVDAAMQIVDADGLDALTLAAVAGRTGVATPSLYKHIGSRAELRRLVGLRVIQELTQRFTAAVLGRSGDDAVATLMREYRAYVVGHPARYAAMPLDPLHDPALAEAGRHLLEVGFAILRRYGLADAEAVHAARCLRAIVHGFASIEASGGFGLPEDVDASYERLIQMYVTSLREHP